MQMDIHNSLLVILTFVNKTCRLEPRDNDYQQSTDNAMQPSISKKLNKIKFHSPAKSPDNTYTFI